jgi:hypothetical protein
MEAVGNAAGHRFAYRVRRDRGGQGEHRGMCLDGDTANQPTLDFLYIEASEIKLRLICWTDRCRDSRKRDPTTHRRCERQAVLDFLDYSLERLSTKKVQ